MKLLYKNGITSVVLRVKILDTASTTGGGKTGLTYASSGLIISTLADNEASATAYTAAGSTIETISTLGTYAAPTSGKCRFKEVDATNHPGLYEIQLANARWAVSNARSLIVTVSGASGAAQVDAEIQLPAVDLQDATRLGLSALPNAAAGANNGLPLGDASGRVLLQPTQSGVTIPTVTAVTNDVGITQGGADKVWSTASRTLSSAGVQAIWDTLLTGITTVGSIGKLIKDNLDAAITSRLASDSYTTPPTVTAIRQELDANSTQLAKLGTPAGASLAADVAAVKTDTGSLLSRLGAWTGSGLNTVLGAFRALAGKASALTPSDLSTGTTFDNTTDSLEALRDRGDAAWTSEEPAGQFVLTVTVRDIDTLQGIRNATVTLRASDQVTRVDQRFTSAAGVALFNLDADTYYYQVSAAGYQAVTLTEHEVTGDGTLVVTLEAVPVGDVAPGTRIARYILVNEAGELVEGETVTARLRYAGQASIDQAFVQRREQSVTTDENGIADFTCITVDQFEAGDGVYIFKAPNCEDIAKSIPAGTGRYNVQEATQA